MTHSSMDPAPGARSSSSQPRGLVLGAAAAEALASHARRTWPEECCGALLGEASRVSRVVPLANVAAQPTRAFEISARDYLAAEAEAEQRGEVLVGFYHSHPTGRAEPSPTDVVRACPWLVSLIVAAEEGGASTMRAFRFDRAGQPGVELPLQIDSVAEETGRR